MRRICSSLLVLGLLGIGSAARAQRTLVIVSGDHQTAQRSGAQVPGGVATFKALTVQLKDAAGKPVAGARVNFVCGKAAMACQMEPAGGSALAATTDANGMAVANHMSGNGATAYYASGKMPITAAADLAAPVTFDLTVTDAPPPPPPTAGATMTLVSGDNQTASRANSANGIPTATYAPLTVLVKDAAGKPLSGVIVTWTIGAHPGAMACQIEPSGASPSTVTTDGNGNATLSKMGGKSASIYYADGQCVVNATYGAATVGFRLNAVPTAQPVNISTLTIVSGDHQTVQRSGTQVPGGVATFKAFTVQLKDGAGKPVAGARVNFLCGKAAMACQLEPAGGSALAATTDANGMAVANHMGGNGANAYYASGKMPITASADLATPVTFDLTVTDAPPPPPPTVGATMTLVSGDNQSAVRLNSANGIPTATYAPLTVLVKDAAGKPLSGVIVTWTIGAHPGAMACQIEPSGASPSTVTTDGNGNATLSKMGGKSASIYYADGQCMVNATYGAATVAFHLNATAK